MKIIHRRQQLVAYVIKKTRNIILFVCLRGFHILLLEFNFGEEDSFFLPPFVSQVTFVCGVVGVLLVCSICAFLSLHTHDYYVLMVLNEEREYKLL
jgi:hypothetical protein